jgi:hypothetical protein
VFCIVGTVFLYCIVYVYLLLLVFSALVYGLLQPSDNSFAVSNGGDVDDDDDDDDDDDNNNNNNNNNNNGSTKGRIQYKLVMLFQNVSLVISRRYVSR